MSSRILLVTLSLLLLGACEKSSGDEKAQAVAQGKFYTVRPNDNLFAIATRAYGNGMLWPEIRRANQWIQDPYQIAPGDKVFVPALDADWQSSSRDRADVLNPPPRGKKKKDKDKDKGKATNIPGLGGFPNVVRELSQKTLFGMPVQQSVLVGFIALLAHSFVESILVWLAAIFTFVKDTSLRKALKAVFLIETLTFATLMILGVLAALMMYVGTSPEDLGGSAQLFPKFEAVIRTENGIAIAGGVLLVLYVILSIRFYPQILGVKVAQAVPILMLAVLLPHILAMYLVGQRLGYLT